MNNERRKILREVIPELQQFVDGKVSESDALAVLNEPMNEVTTCLFDEQDSRDNLMMVTPSGPKVDKADKCVYALEDAKDDLEAVVKHLKDNDADYQGLIDVYIKSAIEHIKSAIRK